jgi:hypothetical protein
MGKKRKSTERPETAPACEGCQNRETGGRKGKTYA